MVNFLFCMVLNEKCQGGLDLPGGDGGPLVVVGKTAYLISGSQSPSSLPSSSTVEKVGGSN